MYTSHLSQRLAVAATIDPQSAAAGTYDSDGIDMSKFTRAIFVLLLGAIAAGGTVDAKLQGSADNSSFADIAGKALTQLTDADADDNKQAVLEISAEELVAASSTYRYVRLRVTTAVAAALIAAVGLAGDARQQPASADDLSTVDEIVA